MINYLFLKNYFTSKGANSQNLFLLSTFLHCFLPSIMLTIIWSNYQQCPVPLIIISASIPFYLMGSSYFPNRFSLFWGLEEKLFDVENSALSLPKLENCVQIQWGENRHCRQGDIIIDKPFLTLGWKSRAERCIFDLNYLLPNANFKRKMVINQYLRCMFGQKGYK